MSLTANALCHDTMQGWTGEELEHEHAVTLLLGELSKHTHIHGVIQYCDMGTITIIFCVACRAVYVPCRAVLCCKYCMANICVYVVLHILYVLYSRHT